MKYIPCPHCKKRIPLRQTMQRLGSKGGSVASPLKKLAARKREAQKRLYRELAERDYTPTAE